MNDKQRKDKCTYWKKYKAIKKPTCGCKYCNDMFDNKQRRSNKLLD